MTKERKPNQLHSGENGQAPKTLLTRVSTVESNHPKKIDATIEPTKADVDTASLPSSAAEWREEKKRLILAHRLELAVERSTAANAAKKQKQLLALAHREELARQRTIAKEALAKERHRVTLAIGAHRTAAEEQKKERSRLAAEQKEQKIQEIVTAREHIVSAKAQAAAEKELLRITTLKEKNSLNPFSPFVETFDNLPMPQDDSLHTLSERPIVIEVKNATTIFHKDFRKSSIRTFTGLVLPWRSKDKGIAEVTEIGRKFSLFDMSFDIRSGDRLAIIGVPRSGKSSLLRLLAGVIEPDVGSVRRYRPVSPFLSLGVGFVPMGTVWENARFNMALNGLSPDCSAEKVNEALDFAGLSAKKNWHLFDLEPEEKRHLSIACTLFVEAEIVLFDGPPVSRDIGFTRATFFLMRERLKTQTLVMTGNAEAAFKALQISRCLMLDNGALVFSGALDDGFASLREKLGDRARASMASTPSASEDDIENEEMLF